MKKYGTIMFFLMLASLLLSYIIPQSSIDYSRYFSISKSPKKEISATPARSQFPIYYMNIRDEGNFLQGDLDVLFINSWDEPLNDIQINLPANIIGAQNINIKSVKVNNRKVTIKQQQSHFKIPLQNTLYPGETIIISLEFETHFFKNFPRFGKYNDTYLLALWYPVIAPRKDGSWVTFPWIYYADPYYFEASIYQVNFYTEKNIISPHPYEDKGDHLSFKTMPIREFTLVLGDYEHTSMEISDGPVISYYYKQEPRPNFIENAIDILGFFNNTFGEYPYPQLIIIDVEMDYFKGMEFSGVIFFNDKESINVFTLAHEIAHQWWYGLVGNDQIKESWIDEGLANYSAYTYCISKGLPQAQIYELSFPYIQQQYRGFSIVRNANNFTSNLEYRQAVYLKGSKFWLKVEDIIGKKEVLNFLRKLQNEYKYEIVTTDMILEALSKKYNIPLEDLNTFLK